MSLLHPDDDLEPETSERELTLSTGAILGLFAGLILLCAVFFAFGYTVRGRQTPPPVIATTSTPEATPSTTNFNSFKPAAGSPAAGPQPASHTIVAPPSAPAAEPAPAPAHPTAPPVPAEAAPLVHPSPTAATRPIASAPPPPVAIPTGSFIVQVAAMSHEEDANLLVGALKARGYPAMSRTDPQDRLFHIQVGPYTNRPAAEAIKARLSADGYNNPIVK
jgi:DedD protein